MTGIRTGMTVIRIDARGPFHPEAALAMLAAHAIPGVEQLDGAGYGRVVTVDGEAVPIRLAFDARGVTLSLAAALLDPDRGAERLADRVRRWLDLDRDPGEADLALAADPLIGPLVAKRPGLRIIGYPDEFEAVAMTVIGQQVSLAAARTFAGRLVAAYGAPLAGSELRRFPEAELLASCDIEDLRARVGLTGARARTLHEAARRWAGGPVLAGLAADEARRLLLAIPGIGPWTADYLQLRALQHPDTFAPGDLVVRRALGLDQQQAAARAEAWAPYRSHALLHLWTEAAYL